MDDEKSTVNRIKKDIELFTKNIKLQLAEQGSYFL